MGIVVISLPKSVDYATHQSKIKDPSRLHGLIMHPYPTRTCVTRAGRRLSSQLGVKQTVANDVL